MSGHLRTCNFELINFICKLDWIRFFKKRKQSDWRKYRLALETYVGFNSISEFVLTWLQQYSNCDIDSVLEKQGWWVCQWIVHTWNFPVFRNCYFFYKHEIHPHFSPYDVFRPMEPVPSNQSMKIYTGEHVLIGHNVNHFQICTSSPNHHGKVHQWRHTSVLIRQEDRMLKVRKRK